MDLFHCIVGICGESEIPGLGINNHQNLYHTQQSYYVYIDTAVMKIASAQSCIIHQMMTQS